MAPPRPLTSAPRCPARRSSCPAGPTRSSTSRPTRRRARRRPVALLRRPRRGDRLRRARLAGGPARPGRPSRTAPTTSCPTPRRPTSTTRTGASCAPEDTMLRLANGRVCFNWYRIAVTIPERVGDARPDGRHGRLRGRDRRLRRGLGERRAAARARRHRRPGGRRLQRAEPRRAHSRRAARARRFQIAVFGINGPISASPPNYIWMRTATLDFYAAGPRAGRVEAPLEVERVDAASTHRARRRAARARGRRLRVHRGPGLDARRRAAVQLAEHERDLPLDAGRARSPCSARRAATPASTSAATTSPARTG